MRRMPKQTLSTIYFQGILPSILYGITVWGNCLTTLFNSVEKTQVRAARFINNISKKIPESLKKLLGNQSFTTTKETWLVKHSKFTMISYHPSWVTWFHKSACVRQTRKKIKYPNFWYVDYKRSFKYWSAMYGTISQYQSVRNLLMILLSQQ